MLEFIKKLLPRIQKVDILEDIRITKSEIDKILTPSYNQAAIYFKTNKPKSKEYEYLANIFFTNINAKLTKRAINIVSQINEALPNISKNISYLESVIEEQMEKDVIRDAISARKSLLIKNVSELAMISRFAIDLLDYIYIKETDNKFSESNEITPEKENIIRNQIGVFARLIVQYSLKPEDYKEIVNSFVDIILNGKNNLISKKVYENTSRDNPFFTVTPEAVSYFTYSPIYHIRLYIANWQVTRYKANEDKKRMLELRLLNLQSNSDNSSDPKIEKEIEYLQNRIERLESELRKMEE